MRTVKHHYRQFRCCFYAPDNVLQLKNGLGVNQIDGRVVERYTPISGGLFGNRELRQL